MSRVHNTWRDKRNDPHKSLDHNASPGVKAFKKGLTQKHGRRSGARNRKEIARTYSVQGLRDAIERAEKPVGEREPPRRREIHRLENTMLLAFQKASQAKE